MTYVYQMHYIAFPYFLHYHYVFYWFIIYEYTFFVFETYAICEVLISMLNSFCPGATSYLLRYSAYCTLVWNFILNICWYWSFRKIYWGRVKTKWVVFRFFILYCASSASIRNASSASFVVHLSHPILRNAPYQYSLWNSAK